MQRNILISISPDELKALIKETFFELNSDQPIDKDERHLSQKEACELLQISQTTIIDWKKRGLIPYHQIRNTRKIYYLKSELITASKNTVRSKWLYNPCYFRKSKAYNKIVEPLLV